MGKIVMTLALTLASLGSSGGRTQAEMNPLFWEVCPYVVEVGAEVIKARLRLKLNSEDLGPAFDILCRVGKYYDQDQEKEPDPAHSERIREFLCRNQDLKYCNQPAKPFSPTPPPETVLPQREADKRAKQLAEQCRQRNLTKTQCVLSSATSADMVKKLP